MTEKEQIEKSTAEGFLKLFNDHYETDYEIIELGDAPDIRCQSSSGEKLNLEITVTEDKTLDIKASLGRSDHRSLEALREHVNNVKKGKERPKFSSLSGNVLQQAAGRINKKLLKRYGSNTALVVRDVSGVDWDWDIVIEDLKNELQLQSNPFDRGIWIVNRVKTRLFQVVEGSV